MKFRKLRITWSITFGIASTLLIALWERSYLRCDELKWQRNNTNISFTSFRGSLGILSMPLPTSFLTPTGIDFRSRQITTGSQVNYNDGTGHPLPSFLGFKSSWLSAPIPLQTSTIVIPYWFPAIVCALAAIGIWIGQLSWRYTLRTLLIAITIIAVELGLVVGLSK